ncbi:hypothetical protein F1640_18410 [Novosphingobium sp. NBM11]|nr:hypothetical protein [Novosphingobium sp. NBM11]
MANTMAAAAEQAGKAPSTEQSTTDLQALEREHRRAFLETFRRWAALFKRRDSGDVEAEKWLMAEYYDSLRHLSPEGLNTLTRLLKENCVFFPSIKECLDLMRPKDRYDFGHPFLGHKPHLYLAKPDRKALAMDRVARLAGPADDGSNAWAG